MAEVFIHAEVNCETGEVIERPFTEQELADLETRRAEAKALWDQREAEAKHLDDLRASAKAKLVAGEPLTEEEASVIVL